MKFKLFASIPVTYHNPGGQNLFGVTPKKYTVVMKDGAIMDIDGSIIPSNTAEAIRRMKGVESIDAYF